MTRQIQDAYIVAATRTPVGKAPRGVFRNTRPDDMLAHVLRSVHRAGAGHRPGAHRRRDHRLRDARSRAGHERRAHRPAAGRACRTRVAGHDDQPLLLVRACRPWRWPPTASALGEADLMIAGGTESMSMVPMMGNKLALNAGGVRATTRTSPSPTAWASPPRRSPSNGRSRARSRTRSRSRRTRRRWRRRSSRRIRRRDHARIDVVDARARSRQTTRSCTRRRVGRRRRRPARGYDARRPRQAAGRCSARPAAVGHRRQQLADARRRRRAYCSRRERAIKDYGLTPLARFVGFAVAGVRARNHGHRPDRRDPEGAAAGRPHARPASTGSNSTKPSPRRRWR